MFDTIRVTGNERFVDGIYIMSIRRLPFPISRALARAMASLMLISFGTSVARTNTQFYSQSAFHNVEISTII